MFIAEFPRDIQLALLAKCLEYEPAKRFPAAPDLVSELAKYLEGRDRMWPESLELKKEKTRKTEIRSSK